MKKYTLDYTLKGFISLIIIFSSISFAGPVSNKTNVSTSVKVVAKGYNSFEIGAQLFIIPGIQDGSSSESQTDLLFGFNVGLSLSSASLIRGFYGFNSQTSYTKIGSITYSRTISKYFYGVDVLFRVPTERSEIFTGLGHSAYSYLYSSTSFSTEWSKNFVNVLGGLGIYPSKELKITTDVRFLIPTESTDSSESSNKVPNLVVGVAFDYIF